MKVLGIETSCDETAAGVVEDGRLVLSNVIRTQFDLHSRYGGVVPELASRRHVEVIVQVAEEALRQAGLRIADLDGLAVTPRARPGRRAPGGALISPRPRPWPPACRSAGWTILRRTWPPGCWTPIRRNFPGPGPWYRAGTPICTSFAAHWTWTSGGRTRDDAAGEAYDKVASCWAWVIPEAKSSTTWPPRAIPSVLICHGQCSAGAWTFRFPVSRRPWSTWRPTSSVAACPRGRDLADLCASFQAAVVDVIMAKMRGTSGNGKSQRPGAGRRSGLQPGPAPRGRRSGRRFRAATDPASALTLHGQRSHDSCRRLPCPGSRPAPGPAADAYSRWSAAV